MRLVVTEADSGLWVQLIGETSAEMLALDACAARGEWTNGRGIEAIADAPRPGGAAGLPGRGTGSPMTLPPSPSLVVVKRDEPDTYQRLTTFAREGVTVIWDRRQGERRITDRPAAADRRHRGKGPHYPGCTAVTAWT